MTYTMFIRIKDSSGNVVWEKMLEAKKINQLKRSLLAELEKRRTFKALIDGRFTVITMSDEKIPPHIIDCDHDDFYNRCKVLGLSKAEINFFYAKSKGRYAKEVSDIFGRSTHTVNNTMSNIYKKLNVSSFKGTVNKLGIKSKKGVGRQLTLFEIIIQGLFLYQTEVLNSEFFQQFLEIIPQNCSF